jgi:membrane associated rhomboid family serine protease
MNNPDIIIFALILLTTYISYRGFQDYSIIRRMVFDVGEIRGNKDYFRLISSGFVHADWTHLIFNMLTFYFFAGSVLSAMGIIKFLILYVLSLLGGNLLALLMRRDQPHYRALGASGAVTGVVFAAIALLPDLKLALLLLPIPMPGWLYGLAFVLYSIYGIRSQSDNIGHEAHLGGGISGLIFTLILYPLLLELNTLPILLILIPSLIFLLIIRFRPDLLNFRKK